MSGIDAETEDPIAEVKSAMRAYAGGEDSPPMRVCARLLELTQLLQASQRDILARIDAAKAVPLEEAQKGFERAARAAWTNVEPEYGRRWKWQRWAITSASAVVVLCAVASSSAFVGYRFGRDAGSAESARWSEWCRDRSHVTSMGSTSTCLIPLSR